MLAYYVKQCSASCWYSGLVGCLLPSVPTLNTDEDFNVVWAREPEYPHCANTLNATDVELVEVPDDAKMWVPRHPPTAAEVTAPLLARLNEKVNNQ